MLIKQFVLFFSFFIFQSTHAISCKSLFQAPIKLFPVQNEIRIIEKFFKKINSVSLDQNQISSPAYIAKVFHDNNLQDALGEIESILHLPIYVLDNVFYTLEEEFRNAKGNEIRLNKNSFLFWNSREKYPNPFTKTLRNLLSASMYHDMSDRQTRFSSASFADIIINNMRMEDRPRYSIFFKESYLDLIELLYYIKANQVFYFPKTSGLPSNQIAFKAEYLVEFRIFFEDLENSDHWALFSSSPKSYKIVEHFLGQVKRLKAHDRQELKNLQAFTQLTQFLHQYLHNLKILSPQFSREIDIVIADLDRID